MTVGVITLVLRASPKRRPSGDDSKITPEA